MSGAFDRTLAYTKLTYCEKYGKATEADLHLFKNVLNANVEFYDGRRRARITYMGKTTDFEVKEKLL